MCWKLNWCPSDIPNQRTNGPVKRSPDIWAKHKIKFGSKWPNHFWEKPVLIFLVPRSRNELDLQYSHIFIISIGFRSQTQKLWKINSFHLLPNLTLSWNRSRSTYGHHLNKLWWAGVIDATYQVSWKSVHRFQRRRFLKGFYHIWAWRPSW